MVSRDQYLKEIFPQPPLTGFKRQRNLRHHLVRAQVPKEAPKYPKRELKGMKKCHKVYCRICPFISETKKIKIDTKSEWHINKPLDCNARNVVYLIQCTKENCTEPRYIGETKRHLRHRLAEHLGYIANNMANMATGAHFTQPGHSANNLKITVIEKVKKESDQYRKEREEYFIRKFNTFHSGMNKKIWRGVIEWGGFSQF